MGIYVLPPKDQGVPVQKSSPFQSNKSPDGGVLYAKVHGLKQDVLSGASHTFIFTVPYANCKMSGAELISNVKGTTDLSVKVPDGQGGYSVTEQYGYEVNIGEVYSRETGYSASLSAGVELHVTVTNQDSVTRKMGVNFILHEVRVL